jgi:hypothetical protein
MRMAERQAQTGMVMESIPSAQMDKMDRLCSSLDVAVFLEKTR